MTRKKPAWVFFPNQFYVIFVQSLVEIVDKIAGLNSMNKGLEFKINFNSST